MVCIVAQHKSKVIMFLQFLYGKMVYVAIHTVLLYCHYCSIHHISKAFIWWCNNQVSYSTTIPRAVEGMIVTVCSMTDCTTVATTGYKLLTCCFQKVYTYQTGHTNLDSRRKSKTKLLNESCWYIVSDYGKSAFAWSLHYMKNSLMLGKKLVCVLKSIFARLMHIWQLMQFTISNAKRTHI